MQIETRAATPPYSGLVIVTADPEDREIRLTADFAGAYRSVRVDSDLPVIIEPGLTSFALYAPRSDVSCAGDLTLQDLHANSYRGDGSLYVLLRMGVEGDVLLSGELKGERHFPYEIGGDLVCDGLDVDGRVRVGGDLITPWEGTRELTVAGETWTPDEARAAGRLLRARPGLTPSPESLALLAEQASPAALARAVASLDIGHWVAVMRDIPIGAAGPLFAEAISVAENLLDPVVPPDRPFLGALYAAWGDERFRGVDAKTKQAVAVDLLNFALGTRPLGFGLSAERAAEVRKFDPALAFLSSDPDDEDRHYTVEEVRDVVEGTGLDLSGDRTEADTIHAVVSVLADPRLTDREAVLAAVEAQSRIVLWASEDAGREAARVREAVAAYLRMETAPEPTAG